MIGESLKAWKRKVSFLKKKFTFPFFPQMHCIEHCLYVIPFCSRKCLSHIYVDCEARFFKNYYKNCLCIASVKLCHYEMPLRTYSKHRYPRQSLSRFRWNDALFFFPFVTRNGSLNVGRVLRGWTAEGSAFFGKILLLQHSAFRIPCLPV